MFSRISFADAFRRRALWLFGYGLLMAAPAALAQGMTFDQALRSALQQSPALQAQAARVDAVRQAQGPADALPDPTLILGLDNVPVDGADRYSLSADFMTMQRIGVMQRFPNRGKREARAERAAEQVALTEAEQDATRLAVLRLTASAWIWLLTLDRQLALLEQLESENRLFYRSVTAHVAAGKGTALDTVLPRQQDAALENRRDDLIAARRRARAELIRWTGPAGEQPLAGEPPAWRLNSKRLQQHLHAHPELAVARLQAAVAQASVKEARAAKKPDWALTLAYMDREEFSDMAMLQVNVDLPLFQRSRQGPRIAAAEAERMSLDAQAEAIRRQHEAMLQADIAEYERLQRTVNRQHDTLIPLAEEKAALATAAWRAGDVALAELVQARSELLESRMTAISLEGKRDTLAATLHFTYDHHGTAAGEHDDQH